MASDLGRAARSLARQPVLAGSLVLTLAAALAANSALFTIFDGLLFRPLPYADYEAIVHVEVPGGVGLSRQESTNLHEALATTPLLTSGTRVNAAGGFEAGSEALVDWSIEPVTVTPEFFDLLGVRPDLGRPFVAEDGVLTNPAPVILGHELWARQYGADPSLVGQVVDIPGSVLERSWLVVGIMPEGFGFPRGANFWRVLHPNPTNQRAPDFARLAAGTTIEMLRREFPRVTFTPLREHVAPDDAQAFGYLLGATGLLLLVAWLQTAALLFARATGRIREVGIRLALGAPRGRVVRQFAAEGIVVAASALLLAWLATPALTAAIVSWLPPEMTTGQSLTPDARTLTFIAVLSIVGVVLLATLPADLIRRATPVRLLQGGRSVGWDATRVRSVLLILQLALTTTLLYVAGLAVHSFSVVSTVPLGFEPQGLVSVDLPGITAISRAPVASEPVRVDSEHMARQVSLQMESLAAIRALPGIRSAVGTTRVPFDPSAPRMTTVVAVSDPERRPIEVERVSTTAGLPATLQLPIIDGRDFLDSERPNRIGVVEGEPGDLASTYSPAHVVLVNNDLARQLEIFGPVVGQSLVIGDDAHHIVGVVGDMAWLEPGAAPAPRIFVITEVAGRLLARVSGGDAEAADAAIRATLSRLWGHRASRQVIRIEDELDRTTADYRARSTLLALLAVLCLPLAAAGLVGAQMDGVRQRSREIAIRLALGADTGSVRRGVVARAMTVVAAGLVCGLLAGALVGRLMSTYLFGVAAFDATTTAGVIAGLLVVAWLAALWPAQRAARIDPARTLRAE